MSHMAGELPKTQRSSSLMVLAYFSRRTRYAIFAFPMVAILVLGALYLGYSEIFCDPLYADDAESAGYESGSVMSVLRPLLPAGFEGDKTMPVPAQNFGAACRGTPQ